VEEKVWETHLGIAAMLKLISDDMWITI